MAAQQHSWDKDLALLCLVQVLSYAEAACLTPWPLTGQGCRPAFLSAASAVHEEHIVLLHGHARQYSALPPTSAQAFPKRDLSWAPVCMGPQLHE